ncbi:hypothetical protein ACFCW4_08845 [Streptomyces virginiae]|uniref:hypothetical protein n=1 Tax=Streptomyces virginiae TaxID=1961 RepID=UPI0035DE56E8
MSYYDETSRTLAYASHDCLEGLLQRGRGLGAIRARQDPHEAAAYVYDGIRRDWKWDYQTDTRYLYQARLIKDLGLSPTPVVEQLAGDEEEWSRAADVLELLALAGSHEAMEGLRAYVRQGPHWARVLESVADCWPAAWWEDLGDVARARIGGEEEVLWSSEPWSRFGIEVPGHRTPPRPSLDGLSDDVPAARVWASDEREWLARMGTDILAEHPGPEALPGLLAELTDQWEARAWCGPDTTAKQLARFGPDAADAAPVLRAYWLHTPHSYERADYLRALTAIDPTGLDDAYIESLWDCEERARLLGIAMAPQRPQTTERIAVLRDDPMETTEVRAAAAARLTAAAGPDLP